jgi:hypothetical protein
MRTPSSARCWASCPNARSRRRSPTALPVPTHGNVSTMRSTWRSHSDFIADLRCSVYGRRITSPGMTKRWQPVPSSSSRDRTLSKLFTTTWPICGYTTVIGMPTFRLGLVAAAAAEGDDVIREAIDASYRESVEPWKQVYTTVLQARGLQLRPGIALDDFATILTAIVDGLALRAVGDAESDVIDDGQPRSPLGPQPSLSSTRAWSASRTKVNSRWSRSSAPWCATPRCVKLGRFILELRSKRLAILRH